MTSLRSILSCALLFCAVTATSAGKPNFLVILVDDLGWRDVGFAGNKFIDTPHIDGLARDGTVFTQAYASAPNCAPTRACLMTGQYPPRHGVYTVVDDRHRPGSAHHRILAAESRPDLATESVTIAEVLRDGGYATAMVGMWNLGRGRKAPCTPTGQGFDLDRQPKGIGFEKDAYHDDLGRYLTNAFAEEGISFIEQNRDKPWFLYFAPHAVHAPFDPPAGLLEKYRRKAGSSRDLDPAHPATVEALDTAIGRLLDKIQQAGMADSTLVIFTSDNGGTRQYVAPLKGGKGDLYEGGLRVPMAVRGPGVRPGARCDTPVLSMDIYPTLMKTAGLEPPAGHQFDGLNLAPLFAGTDGFRRDTVFWHFPSYVGRNGPASAIRHGNLKLIEFFDPPRVEVYDLVKDPGESRDISRSRPDVTRDLHGLLRAWQEATKAPRPTTPNPGYDPAAEPPRGREQRGKGGGGGRGGKDRPRDKKAKRSPEPKQPER